LLAHIRPLWSTGEEQLRELGLNSNQVETTADLVPPRELRSQSLQHNKLMTLGDALAGMRKLEVLRVDGNRLGAGGLGKVPASLKATDSGRAGSARCLPHSRCSTSARTSLRRSRDSRS